MHINTESWDVYTDKDGNTHVIGNIYSHDGYEHTDNYYDKDGIYHLDAYRFKYANPNGYEYTNRHALSYPFGERIEDTNQTIGIYPVTPPVIHAH